MIDVADRLAPGAIGGEADTDMVIRLQQVTGAMELFEVFSTLAAAFPEGTTQF